uniref:Sel-1 suppressor of lin-12-like 3 n=1 Tax=Xenopus tropicalis TaxID=8364 RepID=A0A6I8QC19_XENTR
MQHQHLPLREETVHLSYTPLLALPLLPPWLWAVPKFSEEIVQEWAVREEECGRRLVWRERRMLGWAQVPFLTWQDLRALLLLALIPSLCSTKETSSVTILQDQNISQEDFIELLNLPRNTSNSAITVRYICSRPCWIHVDIVASSEFRTGVSVFKKRWRNEKYDYQTRTRTVNLKFPSTMIYKNDYFLRNSVDVYFAAVRAWLVHIDPANKEHNETILFAAAKTFGVLNTIPPLLRPYKDHQICLTWGFEQVRRQRENTMFVCPCESDAVRMLDFPLASNSRHNGIIRTFQNFRNRELELRRSQQFDNAKFTFSVWIYLLNYCSHKECGIIHHVDGSNMYATPLLFLRDKGQIHVQMRLATETDTAYLTKFKVPLRRWLRMDIAGYARKITFTILLGKELERFAQEIYNLQEDVLYDDTAGYVALGGTKFVRGIAGFFGPVKYYRLRTLKSEEISNPLVDEIYHQIDSYYERCASVQDIVRSYSSIVGKENQLQTQNSSNDLLIRFGNIIYDSIIEKLTGGLEHLGAAVPSLIEASCSGYHKASYLLAVMYETGLHVPVDKVQGLLYSLVGAQGDDRLALLKLGYKHFQGIDGYPLDLDISCSYYINIAKKTPKDRSKKHEEQAFAEAIRLTDDMMLKEQTRENDDLFLWLKQNAERGDPHAQHRLAQMYFWGQQGVTKNIKAALEWYRRGALESEDPIIMYDYAVILFKGEVIRKDMKLALKLMKKAAEKGKHEALNGLGWYYHHFQNDFVNAAKYWKRAYDMGNPDSAYNLGVLYLNGVFPGEPGVNETRAFEYIFSASEGGHIDSIIYLVQYLVTGSLKSVPRNPKAAIIWAKSVAEQNGHIGHVIRRALNAYLDRSLHESVLNYILTAEAGVEVSQTNMAYLCEEHPEFIPSYLMDICILRYYNLSVYQNNPPSVALLKLGDLYYYGGKNQARDLDMSLMLYTQAALQGDSQGFYNLAQLVQEGVSIPDHLLQHLKIDRFMYNTSDSLTLKLYERCQSHCSEESLSPCSFMLIYFHIRAAWHSILCPSLIYGLGSLLLAVVVGGAFLRARLVRDADRVPRRQQVAHNVPSPAADANNLPGTEQTESSARNVSSNSEAEALAFQQASIPFIIRNIKEALRNYRDILATMAALGICIYCVTHAV